MTSDDFPDFFIYSVDLFCTFTFGKQDQVDIMGNDIIEVFNPPFTLVYAHHAFGTIKINGAQGIADQEAGFEFLFRGYCILQVEDNAVGVMYAGIDHLGRTVSRKVKPRKTVSVPACGVFIGFEYWQEIIFFGFDQLFYRCLDAGCKYQRQRAQVPPRAPPAGRSHPCPPH